MTLSEISQRHNVDVNSLARNLGIPLKHIHTRLGWLRKSYGFEMNEVRAEVLEFCTDK
jgi:hypothetical protein